MCEEKWQKGEFPAPPVQFDVSGSTGKKMVDSLVSGMLSAQPDSRPNIHAVLSELARIQGISLSGHQHTSTTLAKY